MLAPRSSSFPLQTGRVYHPALVCLRAPPSEPSAARASHGGTECPTTSERLRTSTPCCATAPSGTRRSTRPGTSWARARRPACASSSATPVSRPTSPWPAASRTRASPRASSASPRTTPPRRGAPTAPASSSTAPPAASTPSCSPCAARATRSSCPATPTSPCLRGSSSPARCRSTWSRSSTRCGASRCRCARPTRWRRSRETPDARALFVTSPTYNGLGADLPRHRRAGARRRHAVRHRSGVGPAPALLHANCRSTP